MRMTIVRAATEDFWPLIEATTPGLQEFYASNGCSVMNLLIRREDMIRRTEQHPSWAKLDHVMNCLGEDSQQAVVWMDADIAVLNPQRSITQWIPKDGINFSEDSNGLCAGFFIARGAWSFSFLNIVRLLGSTGEKPDRQEQNTIKALVRDFPSVSEKIGSIPTSIVSNPECEPSNLPLSFAHHFWANGWEDKQRLADYIKKTVKRLKGLNDTQRAKPAGP